MLSILPRDELTMGRSSWQDEGQNMSIFANHSALEVTLSSMGFKERREVLASRWNHWEAKVTPDSHSSDRRVYRMHRNMKHREMNGCRPIMAVSKGVVRIVGTRSRS